MPDDTVERLAEELQLIVEGDADIHAAGPPGRSACASYRKEERLQFRFMAFFQTLVAVLGVLTLLLLVVAAYHVFKQDKDAVDGVLAGVGAIVSGAGALFLERQRQDARDALKAAQKLLERCG